MSDEKRELCGVLAVYRPGGGAAGLVHRGLCALQHRGQEAAGIVTVDGSGEIHHLRGRGTVSDALPLDGVAELPGERAVGHVRYSTVARDRAENIQPFLGDTPYGHLALAHNGNFKNAAALTRELRRSGAVLSTTMDTELLVHLVARSGRRALPEALRAACERVVGAYSLTFLCDGRVYGLRDAYGIRPLVIGRLGADGWVLASETCALDALGASYVREVTPGELVEIGPHGLRAEPLLPPAPVPAPCVFELVYFARPDSLTFSQNTHLSRIRMGEELARQDLQDGGIDADVVVPVPDSGNSAALGYARTIGLPLDEAILRSRHTGRTFILPDQDAREHGVAMKLSVIRESVRDRRVVLVDDSLVRGTTARQIVQRVRDAGARSVVLRVASPPLLWPCYLGIDMPSREELIANQAGGVEGVRQLLGADGLRYLALDGLRRATGGGPFCRACMDGAYPV